ncbi:hypothetical protein AAFO90_21150 [Phaeobacter sp. CAU 1743]|uniref:hypothetical protein n=1 Tax=Phaeobacter sp. CAU 1743 TaxID=3140367 RepID=UPI00325B8C10
MNPSRDLCNRAGAKQKDIRARLGQPEHVQTVDQARATLRAKMTAAAEKRVDDLKAKQRKEQTRMGNAVKRLKTEQQTSRQSLQRQHQTRQKVEAKARADRIRSGLMGLWDRAQLKLGVGKLPREFAAEIEQAKTRDAGEFHALKTEQLTDRRQLQKSIKLMREKHRRERNDMRSNLGYWLTLDRQSQREALDSHQAELKTQQHQGQKKQQRKRNQGFEL